MLDRISQNWSMSDQPRQFDHVELVRRRAAAGMSIQELVARTGLSYGYVWRLEHGDHPRPTPVTLHKLATALDCDVDDLRCDAEQSAA